MNAETDTKRQAVKLTKREVDALTYEGTNNGACYYWDSEVIGFGVRVYPGGRKAYLVAYRTGGNRKRFLTLGTHGKDLTADEARKLAKKTLGEVVQGTDPAKVREQECQGETMRDLCAAYMERHGNAKKSASEDQRRIDNHILPNWGSLKEQKRDRWITPEELPRLAQAIDEEPNQTARFALWLYLLTGTRKSELLRARWSDVDWTRAELLLADTKAGRTHYIPLSVPAHLVNIDKPWRRVRAVAGVEDARLHDLRRTSRREGSANSKPTPRPGHWRKSWIGRLPPRPK